MIMNWGDEPGIILDCGFWPPARRGHRGLRPRGIADLLYRFALSFFIKMIRRLPVRKPTARREADLKSEI
jgi:hypothetical protein